jgi:hypothetical protein
VRLRPLGTSATVGLLYQPRMIDNNDYGAVGGMRIGRGNRSTRRKPAPVPLFPPQISQDLTWDRTRAAAVGSRRLTAWAMARPWLILSSLTDAFQLVVSNPSRGMHIWLRLFYFALLCVGSCLATGWSPIQGVLPTVYKIHNFIINSEWEQARQPNPSR